MTDDTSAALGRIKAALDYKHRHVQLTEAQAREVLAHIAALEARAEWAEAFGHVFHTLPDGRLDFVAVREGSELGKLHQRAGAAEARAEKLRQERDDFADMIGAELCHQPGTVTAEWDAAKRRAATLAAEVARLREALEQIADAGAAMAMHDGDLLQGCRDIARQALAAAPAAPEDPSEDLRVIDEIAAERRRQIEQEGWTPEHDNEHGGGQLAAAGACYALWSDDYPNAGEPPAAWPWEAEWWKPKKYRRDLIRAAALIVAEIERLDRIDAALGDARHD